MKTIVSISDIHIRIASRHKEYTHVFKKLIKEIHEISPDYIFNLGDTFHQKLSLSPEAIAIARWFFKELGKICPVITIIGNHDVNLTNLDRPNSVKAVLEDIPNQIILEKSEYKLIDEDIAVGVFSLLDNQEKWPVEISKRNLNNINIALYHGPVNCSHNDSGFVIENTIKAKDYFYNYDYVMCGDIHSAEMLDDNNRIWMTGNLIQQTFGEDIDKGFLIWKIKSKDDWTVEKVNIKNPYNFVTINLNSDDLNEVEKEIQKQLRGKGITKNSSIKIKIKTEKVLDNTLKNSVKQFIINKYGINPIINEIYSSDSNNYIISDASGDQSTNLYDLGVQSALIRNYIEECLSHKSLNVEDILKLNKELNTELGSIFNRNSTQTWEPLDLHINNLFSYGKDVKVDFKNQLYGLVGLFGKNASGKSNLFSALTFAVYGKPIKKIPISNILRNKADIGSSKILARKGNNVYKIERNLIRSKSGVNVGNSVNFTKLENEEWISLNEESTTSTNKKIAEIFGTLKDFTMTSMSTQGDYDNFISSGNTEVKEIIMRYLGFGVLKDLYELSGKKISQLNDIIDTIDDTEGLITKLKKLKDNITEIEENEEEYSFNLKKNNDNLDKLNKLYTDLSLKIVETSFFKINEEKVNKEIKDINNWLKESKEFLGLIKDQNENLNCNNISREETNDKISKLVKLKTKISSKIAVLENNIESLEDKNDKFGVINCDRSDCSLLNIYTKDIEMLSSYKDELLEYSNKLQKVEEVELQLLKRKEDLITFNNNKNKIESVSASIESKIKRLAELTQYLDEYNKNKDILEKNSKINEKISIVNEKIKELEIKVAKIAAEKEVNKRLKAEYEDRIEEINVTIEKLSMMKKKINILEHYRHIMNPNALPNVLLHSYINIFESEINRILNSSTDLSVKISLSLKKHAKNTELEILYSDNNEDFISIDLASGAQTMILSLAIRVALINITSIQKSNVLIIDEGFGALSSDNIPILKNLFESFRDMFHSIIIVSHLDSIQDIPEKIIMTHKENGVSTLLF